MDSPLPDFVSVPDPADTLKRIKQLLSEYDLPGEWSLDGAMEYADLLTDEVRRLVTSLDRRHVVTIPYEGWDTFASGIIDKVLGANGTPWGNQGYDVEIGGQGVRLGRFSDDQDILTAEVLDTETYAPTGEIVELSPDDLTWIAVR